MLQMIKSHINKVFISEYSYYILITLAELGDFILPFLVDLKTLSLILIIHTLLK